MESYAVLEQEYDVLDVMFEGGNSVMLLAERKRDLSEVAIKVIRNKQPGTMSPAVLTEIDVLKNLDSSRVVKLLDVLEDEECTYLVMEYLAGGDLFQQLKSMNGPYSERDALCIAEGILEAVVELHLQGIAHRDIKLENIMLEDKDISKVKLVDFGMARWRKNPMASRYSTRICGTPQYLPPQIVGRQAYVPEEADMWCLGVVLYALIAGRLPFSPARGYKLNKAILSQEISFTGRGWNATSKSTRKLVSNMLSRDPSQRPTAAHALHAVREILKGDEQYSGLFGLAATFGIVKRELVPKLSAVKA